MSTLSVSSEQQRNDDLKKQMLFGDTEQSIRKKRDLENDFVRERTHITKFTEKMVVATRYRRFHKAFYSMFHKKLNDEYEHLIKSQENVFEYFSIDKELEEVEEISKPKPKQEHIIDELYMIKGSENYCRADVALIKKAVGVKRRHRDNTSCRRRNALPEAVIIQELSTLKKMLLYKALCEWFQ